MIYARRCGATSAGGTPATADHGQRAPVAAKVVVAGDGTGEGSNAAISLKNKKIIEAGRQCNELTVMVRGWNGEV